MSTTGVVIQLANRSNAHPFGVIEDVLVKMNKLIFPTNFYILEMEGESSCSKPFIILGQPFLKTARTRMDVHTGTLTMEFRDQIVRFSIFDSMKPLVEEYSVMQINVVFNLVEDPLSDLIAELPRLVGFDHFDSLSYNNCDGDYIYPVCAEVNACINGKSCALTYHDTCKDISQEANLVEPSIKGVGGSGESFYTF